MHRGSKHWVVAMITLAVAVPALAFPGDPEGAIGAPTGAETDCARIGLCNPGQGLPNGEAYVGGGLIWMTDFTNHLLCLLDTGANCQVLTTCPAPGGSSPSENAYDGTYLYHYDFGTGLLYAINPTTCQVVYTCDPPGDDMAEGLTYNDGLLWKGDSQTIYGFTPPPDCQVTVQCPNPAGDSADGLTWCGPYLIMLGYSGELYQLDPFTCTIVDQCTLNAGAAGNGIASNQQQTLWADNSDGSLDAVAVDCSTPFPVESSTWGKIKVLFAE
jgi:hypothetical protein